MTRSELLAEAGRADRQADAIFAAINAKSDARPADYLGRRPLIPAGCEADAERASNLRREARWLRAEARDTIESAPASSSKTGVIDPPATPPPAAVRPAPAAGIPFKPKQVPAVDPVEALAKRILAA